MKELPLADPHFDQPGRIDLLIGCNLLQDILGTDICQGDSHQPVARKTIFGWVIMGRYSLSDVKQECSTKTANVCNVGAVVSSDDLLQRFWETEEVIVSTPIYTSEEKEVIEHFNSTYNFLPVGRYQVRLPKRSDASELGESRQQAVRRYYANEKSLIAKKSYNHSMMLSRSFLISIMLKLYLLQMVAVQKVLFIICLCTQCIRIAVQPLSLEWSLMLLLKAVMGYH